MTTYHSNVNGSGDKVHGGAGVKHNRNLVPIDRLEEIRQALNLNESAFSKALGYASDSAYPGAKREGVITATTALAAEALLMRHESKKGGSRILILTIDPVGNTTSIDITNIQRTIQLDGKNYLLIPQ